MADVPAILTVTDFSVTGNNAVFYAAALAARLGAALRIVHANTLPVLMDDVAMQVINLAGIEQSAAGRMTALQAQLTAQFPHLPDMEFRNVDGPLEDAVDAAAAGNPLMIVAGNTLHDAGSGWIDSNLTDMMGHLTAPVLAVPDGAVLHSTPPAIALCCDAYNLSAGIPAQMLMPLAAALNARLMIVHVAEEKEETAPVAEALYETGPVHAALRGMAPKFYFLEKSADTEEALLHFAAQQEAAWLCVVPHRHSFLYSLFHKSHTRQMLRKSSRPVLSLHGAG